MKSLNTPRILADTGESVSLFTARSFQLVSLWDMLKFLPYDLLNAVQHLEIAQQDAAGRNEPAGPGVLEAPDKQFYREAVNMVKVHCETFQLESTLDQIGRIEATLNGSLFGAYRTFASQTQQILECLKSDLEKRLFLFMPPDEARYYDREELFDARVKARFPEANKEIVVAGNCYATGNYTACVFHLTRVVEIAARVMVSRLKVPKAQLPKDIQGKAIKLLTWDQLLKILDAGVEGKRAGSGINENRKKTFEFYNHAMSQFRNFKDAWRNKVSHKRKTYQPGEANDIMKDVERFMIHISQKLSESKGAKFD